MSEEEMIQELQELMVSYEQEELTQSGIGRLANLLFSFYVQVNEDWVKNDNQKQGEF